METKKRDSNLELMRIIMMLLIIAHHYVVNSGITQFYSFSNITSNMIFLQCIGFSGKIMINCFIMITGYFMITGKINFQKIVKLYFEIKFYKIIIYVLFVIWGIDSFSVKELIKTVFNIIYGVNIGFSDTFFLLYLLIPFINVLLNKLTKKQYTILLCILLFYFTIISTFSIINDTFNEITWYIVVYMIGGYIRLYPPKHDKNKKVWLLASVIFLICSIISIIGIDFINNKFNTSYSPYFFVINAHKLLAILSAISFFMLFKNIKIKYNKTINTIASATFGVLLIHAGNDSMRKLIWKDIFHVSEQYYSQYIYIHAILTIITIYVVCVCIELLRIKFIEKRLFDFLNRNNKFKKISNYIDNMLDM